MNKTHIATIGERFFMSKIAIATDSNSGITQAQGRELGIFVMPMPFTSTTSSFWRTSP